MVIASVVVWLLGLAGSLFVWILGSLAFMGSRPTEFSRLWLALAEANLFVGWVPWVIMLFVGVVTADGPYANPALKGIGIALFVQVATIGSMLLIGLAEL